MSDIRDDPTEDEPTRIRSALMRSDSVIVSWEEQSTDLTEQLQDDWTDMGDDDSFLQKRTESNDDEEECYGELGW